ncbi:MAG: Cys-tRNA(Pro) deacylase [Oscillospiraceae bacterium]|nr:Cys-tRNA(Pro) deacylase [Oscillospiraceae bacterium]
MAKDTKTNAMRILEQKKIPFRVNLYSCDEFIDAVHVADQLGQDYDCSFKTLVAVGKSGEHYVYVVPIAEELDLKKAAKSVGEKSVELIHVKEIFGLTGYIRGGCTPIGMKKQFQTVVDETAQLFEEIIISGGRIGAQILIDPMDLERAISCSFEDITV